MVQVRNNAGDGYQLIEYKGVVDPIDQAEDYFSVLNWINTHPKVDINNIGLWGTSW